MKNNSEPSQPSAPPPPQRASNTRRLVKRLFNVRAWLDWERSMSIAQYFLAMIERFFVIRRKSKVRKEAFGDAVTKFDLNEEDLKAKALGLKRVSYAMLMMFGILVCYGFYQLFYGSLRGLLISVVEMGIALVLAFRYHFWSFQIKKRKLGCSIKEWYRDFFTGGRP